MLHDIISRNLKVVICGTSVGHESALRGNYYANPANRFWRTLFRSGITPMLLTPSEDHRLSEFGVGLTDLVKLKSGTDKDLVRRDFDAETFLQNIRAFAPRVVCFNGKTAAKIVLGRRQVEYGFQSESVGKTRLFVAPSTSGAANGYWDEDVWMELGTWLAEDEPGRSGI
jgi:double-stranded uracil-DNA glycosylase